MTKHFICLLIFFFIFTVTHAQKLSNESAVDSFIKKQIKQKKIAGAVVLISHKGKTLLHNSYGHQDIDDQLLMDSSSIFRIYSMTKPITSLATMMLVDRDSIRLDDPVEIYLPELKNLKVLKNGKTIKSKSKITVRDLLRHTSGFAYGFGLGLSKVDKMYNDNHPLDSKNNNELLQKLSKLPLKSNPGGKFNYSISVDVLGCLIERVSGMSLFDFFKQNILEPLNMNDTHFKLPKSKIDRFCSYYKKGLRLKEHYKKTRYLNDGIQSGGGGLVSTSSDYLKFCKLLTNKGIYNKDTLISPIIIKEMTKNQLPSGEGVFKIGKTIGIGFGLGFMVYMKEWGVKGHKGEYGWSGIGGTHFYISPKDDLIVIIMSQKAPFSNLLVNGLKPIIYKGLKNIE